MTWIRGGPTSLDSRNIKEAIDNSLLRVQTDYIDLYHVHWPDRYVPMFGETDYDPVRQYSPVSFDEQLDALGRAVDAGKIRFIGVSNETPYGVMKFLQAAENNSTYPRIASIQVLYHLILVSNCNALNSYNLLCRNFDSGLAECCHLERVSLLAYSPLAMGLLSGKYLLPDGGADDARLNLFKGRYSEGESRYNLSNTNVREATKAYVSIAERYGIHPVSLAIGFVLRHPLVSSTIFGATKLWQLEQVVSACDIKLSPQIIADIDEVHSRFPNPCS
ncbi:Aldo/keto reductase [Cynara cardunculus var. scolymus]|uniref:Aldo/keto reductase n=1 Tax=Cynara cardunculus var. scolymus TaxID=59895 RepID=A0A103Y7I4_CYNCS|nr:Aldo/keto reductase [Cynara cardunculus var. scolymus]